MIRYWSIAIALLFIVPSIPAQGQWGWKMTHAPVISDTQYIFTALSCERNFCTAACIKVTDYSNINKTNIWIMLERSNDGGKTWVEQKPGLPLELGENQTQIRGIQQIDSLNVVAYGDSGLIIRTTDAGKTWLNESIQTNYEIKDMDFSDSLSGIACETDNIVTTSNAGLTWSIVPFGNLQYLWQCHTEGSGRYELFSYGGGKLYSTVNNWQTVDSSFVIDSTHVVLGYCIFSKTGDTLAALGEDYDSSLPCGLIYLSTDHGAHWTKATGPSQIKSAIPAMSGFDHDTLIAGGLSINKLLVSTDCGFHLELDTIPLDTNYMCYGTIALAMTGDGHPIGAFTHAPFNDNSILARGELGSAAVRDSQHLDNLMVYPNPATTSITLSGHNYECTVQLLDLLGRDVLTVTVPPSGALTLDVSHLPRGMYEVMQEKNGQMVPGGKFVLQ